jgi:crotonobetainyl-CoA:carnitine CoA-transferase CaiB-like acyl-CoA transferase
MAADGVLGGIKVVDLSEQVPGPYATRLLAGLGADVIKVERPDSGDRLRHRPAMFEAENRGKRDLSVDLKSPEGRAALLRVIAAADVLVETYRPGVMDRLGLGFDAVLSVNPRIIYLSISGYGATGPYRDLPGHDFQYLSFAGAIPPPEPAHAAGYVPTTLPVADMGAALYSVLAVVLALHEKLARPSAFAGRHLDMAMADCTLAMMEPRIAEALTEPTSADALVRPGYGIYLTADGRYVSIGALEDHFWARLVRALELDELSGGEFAGFQQRRRRISQIEPALRERIARYDRAALIELLIRHDVPVAPVNDLHEPVRDPHFLARRMVYQVPGESLPRVAEWPAAFGAFASGAPLAPTPLIGQHSREVLAEHGLGDAEISALVEAGVVRQAAASLGMAPCFAGLAEDPPDLTALLRGTPGDAGDGQ